MFGGTQRERGRVHVPRGYRADKDWPLVVMFHGDVGRLEVAFRSRCAPHLRHRFFQRSVYDRDGARGLAYRGRSGEQAVVYYTLDGHGHHGPGARSLLPTWLAGPNIASLSATDVVWRFFAAHALSHDRSSRSRSFHGQRVSKCKSNSMD